MFSEIGIVVPFQFEGVNANEEKGISSMSQVPTIVDDAEKLNADSGVT